MPDPATDSNTNVDDLLTERESKWGDPYQTLGRVGRMWGALLGLDRSLTAYEVNLLMIAYKLVRAEVCPDEPDSLVDVHGYATLAQRADMIDAMFGDTPFDETDYDDIEED